MPNVTGLPPLAKFGEMWTHSGSGEIYLDANLSATPHACTVYYARWSTDGHCEVRSSRWNGHPWSVELRTSRAHLTDETEVVAFDVAGAPVAWWDGSAEHPEAWYITE